MDGTKIRSEVVVRKQFIVEVTFERETLERNYQHSMPVKADDLARAFIGETSKGALKERGYEVKIISEGQPV